MVLVGDTRRSNGQNHLKAAAKEAIAEPVYPVRDADADAAAAAATTALI
jgi:hypothetical protein